MKNFLAISGLLFLLFACSNSKPDRQLFFHEEADSSCKLQYAKGFTIDYYGKKARITVKNPWQGAESVEYQYVLTKNKQSVPGYTTLQTPVKQVVCLSTTHIGMLEALNEIPTLKGVSGKSFIMNSQLQKQIKAGKVKDVGSNENLNYELLIDLSPDLLFAYEVQGNSGYTQKLNALDIPVVFNGDYLENSPLGRMEWIKFTAAFYNKETKANRLFNKVADAYKQIKKQADTLKERPSVFTGLPFKGTWYVPGGNSYLANLIRDAGGAYLWADNQKRESIALSNEVIFAKAKEADIWLHPGRMKTLEKLGQRDPRFKQFDTFTQKQVYNNNGRINQTGGNDFYETGIMEPHVLLKDLLKIFHPHALPAHDLTYYRKVN